MSLMADPTRYVSIFNGTVASNASWFFCAADSQGLSLSIPALSSLTTPVIDQYCYTSQYYNRLSFSDNAGCCSEFERCTSVERVALYDNVLLCNVVLLAAIGCLVAICSYIQVTLYRINSVFCRLRNNESQY